MTIARAWPLPLVAWLTLAQPAAAHPLELELHPSEPLGLDVLGPVRIGWGRSRLFDAPILSLSFEDHLLWSISDHAMLGLAFGMDGQRTLDDRPETRGFLATGIGPSLLLGSGDGTPALVLSAVPAPLWQSHDDETSLSGFGIAGRVEVWPFHQSIEQAVLCRRGTFQTYVLSGLSVWALGREDWLGQRGESWAAGIGIDLGRNVLLPILGALLDSGCGQLP